MIISDGGAAGGCPGGCCIPACNVIVSDDSLGAYGSAAFADTCKQGFDRDNGEATIDINDDHQVTWLHLEDGQVVVDIYRKSDKKYNRWAISNCQLATTGGSQCAPSGGGCVSYELWAGQSMLTSSCRTLRKSSLRLRARGLTRSTTACGHSCFRDSNSVDISRRLSENVYFPDTLIWLYIHFSIHHQ